MAPLNTTAVLMLCTRTYTPAFSSYALVNTRAKCYYATSMIIDSVSECRIVLDAVSSLAMNICAEQDQKHRILHDQQHEDTRIHQQQS